MRDFIRERLKKVFKKTEEQHSNAKLRNLVSYEAEHLRNISRRPDLLNTLAEENIAMTAHEV